MIDRKAMKKYRIILVGLTFLIIVFMNKYFNKYYEIASSKCSKDDSVASIVWKRTFPFFLVDAYLIVTKPDEGIIYKQLLLSDRDDFGDISAEFLGISWDCKLISLDLDRNRYQGTSLINPQ